MPAKKAATTGKKASPVKAGAQATITLRHLAAQLAEDHAIPKKQTEAMLGNLVALTARHLKKGDKVRLTGIGMLQVRKRAARMGRNPATGEAIKIKAIALSAPTKSHLYRGAGEWGKAEPGQEP